MPKGLTKYSAVKSRGDKMAGYKKGYKMGKAKGYKMKSSHKKKSY